MELVEFKNVMQLSKLEIFTGIVCYSGSYSDISGCDFI